MIKALRCALPVLDARHSAIHDRKKCIYKVFAPWVSALLFGTAEKGNWRAVDPRMYCRISI